jgi:hypothetical protein
MDALNTRLADLREKKKMLQKKRDALSSEEKSLEMERMRIEQERLRLSQKLSPQQEMFLKQELTAVGELLELTAVIKGKLQVISAPAEDENELYTISIKTELIFSWVTGLSVNVLIKTVCPQVEAIVRSLFIQEGDLPETIPLYYERDCDHGTRIRLTTHEALS